LIFFERVGVSRCDLFDVAFFGFREIGAFLKEIHCDVFDGRWAFGELNGQGFVDQHVFLHVEE
jgi:hypothetical protein